MRLEETVSGGPDGRSLRTNKPCDHCGVPFVGGRRAKYCDECIPKGTNSEQCGYRQRINLYGVDAIMYDAMYFEQDGRCLICLEREAKVVDHCHDSGKVRGLLCLGCNTLLGFMEKPGQLDRALEYLGDSK